MWLREGAGPSPPHPVPERCLPAHTQSCRWTAETSDNPTSLKGFSFATLPACLWKSNSQMWHKNPLYTTLQQQTTAGMPAAPSSELLHAELLSTDRTRERWSATCCRTESSYSPFRIFLTTSKFLWASSGVVAAGALLRDHKWKLRTSFSLWRTLWMTGYWVFNDSNPLTSYGRAFEFDIFININLFILNVCCLRKSLLVLTHV